MTAAARHVVEKLEPRTDWLDRCLRDGQGNVLPIVANALIAMRCDPALVGCFAYDRRFAPRC